MKVISLDCESNGLGGQAFAAAAILTDDNAELDVWTARCPIVGPVDPWVAGHVLPALEGMPETCADYQEMLAQWRAWYTPRRDGAHTVGHVVWPVEARFLLDAHADDAFTGPYPLVDVASVLLAHGHDPTSVDAFLRRHKLLQPAAARPVGDVHHPLYDARVAEFVFRYLMRLHRGLGGPDPALVGGAPS